MARISVDYHETIKFENYFSESRNCLVKKAYNFRKKEREKMEKLYFIVVTAEHSVETHLCMIDTTNGRN